MSLPSKHWWFRAAFPPKLKNMIATLEFDSVWDATNSWPHPSLVGLGGPFSRWTVGLLRGVCIGRWRFHRCGRYDVPFGIMAKGASSAKAAFQRYCHCFPNTATEWERNKNVCVLAIAYMAAFRVLVNLFAVWTYIYIYIDILAMTFVVLLCENCPTDVVHWNMYICLVCVFFSLSIFSVCGLYSFYSLRLFVSKNKSVMTRTIDTLALSLISLLSVSSPVLQTSSYTVYLSQLI